MPARPSLTAFGQELYPDHAAQALRLALEAGTRAELHQRIAAALPQRSTHTRARIADKLIQRLIPVKRGKIIVSPFVRLAARTPDAQARSELIYYRTARTDAVIAAIAADIFYPYFILGRPPRGFSSAQFRMANTGALFDYDDVIARSFVSAYAHRVWRFESEATLTRALRILREAGLIRALGGARSPCFVIAPHTMRLPTFALCLYEEFAAQRSPTLALDQIQSADFARMFILRPVDVTALVEEARRRKLVARAGGAPPRYAPVVDLDTVVEVLLSRGGR